MSDTQGGYSLAILGAEVRGPDGELMYAEGSRTWYGMSYDQLVDLEEALGHALVDAPIALGRRVQPTGTGSGSVAAKGRR